MPKRPHSKPSTACRPVRIELDHARYLSERRYRREVLLNARRQMHKRGLYLLNLRHAADGSCCRQEPSALTGQRLAHQLRLDGQDVAVSLAPAWSADPPVGLHPGAVSRHGPLRPRVSRFLAAAKAGGQGTFCEHIRANGLDTYTRVFGWLADPHSRVTCEDCSRSFARGIAGSAEDATCDSCRQQVATIHPSVALLEPIAGALPPLALLCGLCEACLEAGVLRPVEAGAR